MNWAKLAGSVFTLITLIGTAGHAQPQSREQGTQSVQSATNPEGQISIPEGESSLSGCLQGKTDCYRLTEKDGTIHLLIETVDLSRNVGHIVQLVGYPDDERDASASSDEGTPVAPRFFLVEQVVVDSGQCPKVSHSFR